MNWFRDLRLGIKLNLLVIAAIIMVAIPISTVLRTATGVLIDELGQLRIQQEISIIQEHINRAGADLNSAGRLLANTRAFVDAVAASDIETVEPLLRTTLASFHFDEFDIINAREESLIASDDGGFAEHDENKLLNQTLFGIERVTVAAETNDDATQLELVLTRPLRDTSGTVIGGLLLSLRLDDEFLNEINLNRQGVELLLLYNDQVIAVSDAPGVNESVMDEAIPIQAALVQQALNASLSINKETVYSASGIPHSEAYLPFKGLTDALPQSVIVLRVDNAAIINFQQTLRNSLQAVMLFVLAIIITGMLTLVHYTVTRRLNVLQKFAVSLSQADYSQRSNLRGRDEIGQLGQIFNGMADTIQERESNLKDLNQSLEKRVEERTFELTQQAESLRVATARAREAARIKGEFLANVSHELRTPLNAIIGFADMLLMGMSGEMNDKQKHKLSRLKENGVRLLSLINNILDITRIEARRIEVVSKPFAPHDMIDRITEQMTVLAEQRSLDFRTSIHPDVPVTLNGDQQRIEQIVVNLLSNAFKFTDTGSVTLDVFADQAQNNWGFIVTDTGIGIPPHALHLIFEEFRQVDGSSSRAYKGSGLGLAITRNLVRIMDGHIEVTSEPGTGSKFTVTFPIVTAETTTAGELEKAGI